MSCRRKNIGFLGVYPDVTYVGKMRKIGIVASESSEASGRVHLQAGEEKVSARARLRLHSLRI